MVSMRNSLLSCIIWINDSHWALTSRSNSLHDSCEGIKQAILIYTLFVASQQLAQLLNFSVKSCCRARGARRSLQTWKRNFSTERIFQLCRKKFMQCLLKCSLQLAPDVNFKELGKINQSSSSWEIGLGCWLKRDGMRTACSQPYTRPSTKNLIISECLFLWIKERETLFCLPSLCRSFLWVAV